MKYSIVTDRLAAGSRCDPSEIRGSNEGVAWFGQVFERERDGLVEVNGEKNGHKLWRPYTEERR